MSEKAIFHLFIPCLLEPLNSLRQIASFDIEAPNLSSLLTCFKKDKKGNSQSLDQAFFETIHAEKQELPIAYYRHQIHTNTIRNGLICADPVHLEVGMSDVTLTKKITDLSDSEAKELIDLLNKHFAEDGLQFIFGSNQCWYLSFDENGNEIASIQSHDLDSVLKQNITEKIARSTHRNWQVIQNETQMLLYNSDINQQREIAGLDTINSLWFWGAGKPQVTKTTIDNVVSSKEISSKLRGQLFSRAANCEWHEFPQNYNQLFDQQANKMTTNILLLDQLFAPTLENNLDDFQIELTQLDKNIIAPLLELWQKNDIEIIINCCDGTILKPQKYPIWKFWLKPKKLQELLDEINS